MKYKVTIILALIITVCLAVTSTVVVNASTGFDSVLNSYSSYKQAKELNSDTYKNKVEENKKKINELSERKTEAEKELETVKAEVEKVNQDRADKLGDEKRTPEIIYKKFVESGVINKTSINKFFTSEDNSFTLVLTGNLPKLNSTFKSIRKAMEDWGLSIGNISIRQNYDAYNLGRTYDDDSKLTWYDQKIINALGEVIDLNDFIIEEDEDKTIKYAVKSLDTVEYDQEGYNTELLASNSLYEQKITDLNTAYADQKTILEKSEYTDEVKEDLAEKLEKSYQQDLKELKAEKKAEAKKIKTKYDKKYAADKRDAANRIKTYKDKVDELKTMLADSSKIEYRMDLTIHFSEV